MREKRITLKKGVKPAKTKEYNPAKKGSITCKE